MLKLRITWNLFLSKTSQSRFHYSCQVQTVPSMIRSLKLRHCFLTLLQNITFRLQFLIISKNFLRKLKNDTLCSLLSCKFNQNRHCYEYAPLYSIIKVYSNNVFYLKDFNWWKNKGYVGNGIKTTQHHQIVWLQIKKARHAFLHVFWYLMSCHDMISHCWRLPTMMTW